MENLQPVLVGFTTKDLWDYIHPVALAGWVVLCAAPRWRYTMPLVLVPILINAALYGAVLLPIMLFPDPDDEAPDLSKMESVFAMFQKPDIFFVGWVHYLVFDLLVARGCAIDAISTFNVSYLRYYLMVVPCLLSILYVGPVGFLLHMILRTFVLKEPKTTTSSKKKKKN